MIKLIKNELKKIFKKKSMYILFIVIFAIILFRASIIYEREDDNELIDYIISLNYSFSTADTSTYEGLVEYSKVKSNLEIANMVKDKYGENSWQAFAIAKDDFIARDMFFDYYFIPIQEESFEWEPYKIESVPDKKNAKQKYDEINKIFESDDWQTLARMLIDKYEKEIDDLEKNKVNMSEDDYLFNKREKEIQIETINIRLEKDIPFGFDFLNDTLEEYERTKLYIYDYEEIKKEKVKKYSDKLYYQQNLEEFAESKYIIENKQDIKNTNTVRYRVSSVFEIEEGSQLFIILLIIFFVSPIVSDEYNKGTVKQLLIRPYTRFQVLLAKFITCLIMILFASLSVIFMNLLANIILYGKDSLEFPMTIYNFNNDSLMVMNICKYLIIQFVAKFPIMLAITIIAFACSTIFGNSLVSALASLFVYIGQSIIFEVTEENVYFMRFFLTSNLDLSGYLFGKLGSFETMTESFSIEICLVYFVILLTLTFTFFKNGDIKNR